MKNFIFVLISLILTYSLWPNPTIHQVTGDKIKIDGNLEDWQQVSWHPLLFQVDGSAYTPTPNLDATVAFAFDKNYFYVAVKVQDDHFQVVDRSWRYGDGFLFTLVSEKDSIRSTEAYQYGFAKDDKQAVFAMGEYFPSFGTSLDIKSACQQQGSTVYYETAIPFWVMKPFNPFVYEKVALNLIYTDGDELKRQVVMLTPDPDYDTERTNQRGGTFFNLQPFTPKQQDQESFHTYFKKNFFKTGETLTVGYALNLLQAGQYTIEMSLFEREKRDNPCQVVKKVLTAGKGLTRGQIQLPIGQHPMTYYRVHLMVSQENEKPKAGQKEPAKEEEDLLRGGDFIYIMNPGTIAGYKGKLSVSREQVTAKKDQSAILLSLANLDIRFDWFESFYRRKNYRDIMPLIEWQGEIELLLQGLEKGEPATFPPGTVKRYAHRSAIDNTLQPYSVFLPNTFKRSMTYPLIVALHGSGVDEIDFIHNLVRRVGSLGCPVIAPKARDISGWYLGDSGKDVFECIEHFLSIFPNIDRRQIFLGGFSMGGYGTWRLGLQRPGYFSGLIILSGALVPAVDGPGENILDILDDMGKTARGKLAGLGDILIIHGDQDRAIPIDNTRLAVKKLKALGLSEKLLYIEVPGGGHGNYNKYPEIIQWLKNHHTAYGSINHTSSHLH